MKKIPILLISLLSMLFMFNVSNNTVNAAGTIGTSGGVSSGGGGSGYDFDMGLYAQYGEPLTIEYTTGSGDKYVSIPASLNRYAGVGNYKREYNLKADWAYLTAPYLKVWDTDGAEGESDHGGTAWYSWPFLESVVISKRMGLVGKGLRLPPRGGIVGNAARYLRSKGGVIDPNGCWHWNGQRVDLVCTWGGETPPPPSYQNDGYREVIVKLTGSVNHDFDDTGYSNRYLYHYGKTSVPYDGKSKEKEWHYKKKITATVYRIKEVENWDYRKDKDGNWVPYLKSYSYQHVGSRTIDNDFTYDVSMPRPTTKDFAPFNLNKSIGTGSGAMTSSEDVALIRRHISEYKGGGPALQINPDNMQGIVDGDYMKALDTNTEIKFNITWNNNQYGLTGITLQDYEPVDYAMHKIDSTGVWAAQGSYNKPATDLFGHVSDTQYFKPQMTAGLSSDKASLTYNGGDERIGAAISIARPGAGSVSKFGFKTTDVGDYRLTDGNGIPFFMLYYNAGLQYTYGMKYNGIVTLSGFGAPNVSGELYKAKNSQQVRQPILYGGIKAKTIAGNNRNEN